jgi:hypothetical protein
MKNCDFLIPLLNKKNKKIKALLTLLRNFGAFEMTQ